MDDEDEGLHKIEEIIGQIQGVVEASATTPEHGNPFKNDTKLTNAQKRKWHNKGVSRFGSSDAEGISKLEELLLNYTMSETSPTLSNPQFNQKAHQSSTQ